MQIGFLFKKIKTAKNCSIFGLLPKTVENRKHIMFLRNGHTEAS